MTKSLTSKLAKLAVTVASVAGLAVSLAPAAGASEVTDTYVMVDRTGKAVYQEVTDWADDVLDCGLHATPNTKPMSDTVCLRAVGSVPDTGFVLRLI